MSQNGAIVENEQENGQATAAQIPSRPPPTSKDLLFEALLAKPDIDLAQLQAASWTRIPDPFRGAVWQLLLGYLPTKLERRETTLNRKRKEYFECIPMYYASSDADRSEEDQKMLRQILLDIPRTNPGMPVFHSDRVRSSFERILYIWAIRHPASGYVQGMNDLVTPFYVVFLAQQISGGNIEDINKFDMSTLDAEIMDIVEADSYWCLTKLLDGIQDHYTVSQPGIQRMVYRLQAIIQRIDQPLHDHLHHQNVDFNQFAFRWMNCLLVRELELGSIVRLWDTYLSEDRDGFDSFHVYVCAALLENWSSELTTLDFQDLIMFLQDLPTRDWGIPRVQELLAEAYMLKTLYNESPSHLG
mmetsp:Transcript_4059/g.7788  ORF Transcript_4059/g.7788 Transcript_4059/m.7788 type:complete len:358 (-) Transcript_4059:134-1207(-)|eukprot:CAMPEP_0184513158 /NCGR_PEP_ID=MMETSP0198_2-20121128/3276_1 /TAXON_ID=1112570 /ORGANISM="Thraustochytrium sp., Strain LLF1b" /LENGTH=357 /DNA_ID=CAMNT_0026903253 /DNA_START=533 /DNA_END=1606 /DNA_ORIENTATION=+